MFILYMMYLLKMMVYEWNQMHSSYARLGFLRQLPIIVGMLCT